MMRNDSKPTTTTGPIDRRTFLRRVGAAGLGAAGLSLAGPAVLRGAQAPNNSIRVAVMGVNGRGRELALSFDRQPGCLVAAVCDVDSRAIAATIDALMRQRKALDDRRSAASPSSIGDFRHLLDDRDIDALVIAAPDHWHAPAALLALDAGKHVYVEKPCGHNPWEGELLVRASERFSGIIQMGTQQRSAPESIEIIEAIHDGLIGRPYLGRCWYANTRGSIGRGKAAGVPAWLDYELWQGPAPRKPYRDNVIHYNWHWFWHWGTGEICNNGTHEIDICRWALGVDYPVRVSSAGGRFHFDDDWEAYDTQIATFDFDAGSTIVWEGRSCNGRPIEGRGRGSSIHGEKGTVIIDRAGYIVYDNDNREIRRRLRQETDSALDTRGGGRLTDLHIANFLAAIRDGAVLSSPIDEGHKSVLLCHLGNIAQRVGRSLDTDPRNGRIEGDREAAARWRRDYEKGWKPRA